MTKPVTCDGRPGRLSWSADEAGTLRSLHLNPRLNGPARLEALVRYFKDGGGVWSVSEGGTGAVQVSRGLAIKVRNLTRAGQLDWVLDGQRPEERQVSMAAVDPALTPYRQRHWDDLVQAAMALSRAFDPPYPLTLLGNPARLPTPGEQADLGAEPLAPMLEALRSHLGSGHPVWAVCLDATRARSEYVDAVVTLARTVESSLVGSGGVLSGEDLPLATTALLADAFAWITSGAGHDYSYALVRVDMPDGGVVWALNLGAWHVGHALSAADLTPLRSLLVSTQADLRRQPALELTGHKLGILAKQGRALTAALGPKAAVELAVLRGRCGLCP